MRGASIGRDLLFETNRFNLSEVREHFINPCCFGEDVAAWLRAKLSERGIRASAPDQEDWGWYLGVEYGGSSYLVGVGGNAAESGEDRNDGEWRVLVEKHRSFWDRVRGRGLLAPDDELLAVLRAILDAEPDFRNVRFEAEA
jgi:hypothetical protein